ncbi:ATP-binding protein [Petroclostridium sp. X23]|uniref:ATP-binding protein n=1 Tax=Petroclostridium sp. X23 TaxID=3045146 RepID=UPI0024AE7FCB|nr:ATP-binding protein [Petroclostridium sp. X23]WHH58805.1 ATP-binding protein [Petroclostridium sp. X23]
MKPIEYTQKVIDPIEDWDLFKQEVDRRPTLRPITAEAWKRCKKRNIQPDQLKCSFLTGQELKDKLKAYDYLIKAAKPYMKHLSLSLTGIPHLIVLSDSDGWVLCLNGTPDMLGGRDAGLCVGSSWNEKIIGNNGIGTALIVQKPVLVYGIEHYVSSYKNNACLGVPIKKDNEIIGALNITIESKHAHPVRMTIVEACVSSIEQAISDFREKEMSKDNMPMLMATSDLIATAVHDLKNPVAVIRGLSELGRLTSNSNKGSEYFNRIINQVDLLNRMLIDLLDIFRPQQSSKGSPSRVIQQIISDIEPVCIQQNISIKFKGDNSTKIILYEKLFRRAIQNILDNSIKVMPDGGKISVKAEETDDHILISISDTGPGIPKELTGEIFNAFTFRRDGGTGLGLFMVFQVITCLHRGKIWFQSGKKGGTTFYISLPKDEEHSQN